MIDHGLKVRLNSIDEIPLEQLRQWRNDYRIWKWCRQNDLISKSAQSAWRDGLESDKSIQMYSIFDLNNQGIGVCGLTSIDLVNRHAEFSLYIAPNFQRSGYGKEALNLLISHAFCSYGLEYIWGETYMHNPAAKTFRELGFTLDGIRRNFYFREGRFIDAHLYGILRYEWEKSEIFEGCRKPISL